MEYIQSITIESRLFPTIVIDDPLAPGTPNPLLSFIRPKISVQLNPVLRNSPIVSEPWGEPGASLWPVLQVVGLAVLVVAAVLIVARVNK